MSKEEHMEITITVNGKPVKATVDEKEMREAMGEKEQKQTGYERVDMNNHYYSINEIGEVYRQIDYRQKADKNEYESGNYYSAQKVAENNARADTLMRKLRRFAAEHGGCVAPKKSGWEIYCIRNDNSLGTHIYSQVTSHGIILFSTKEDAEKAIEVFRDDLLWYFTEYDPMPEGWWDS